MMSCEGLQKRRHQDKDGEDDDDDNDVEDLFGIEEAEESHEAEIEKPQVLKVYCNLAQAFVKPHTAEGSEQHGQCIWGILQKKTFKAKDYPGGESVQLSMLEPLLEKNLKLVSKPYKKKKYVANPLKKKQSASWNRHKTIASLAQNSTFWILKIIDSRKFPESELQ
ncbi:hypothetical protein LOK49_LG02G03174 [Camellia lanceoleosa]|uniref:Uncharacterized protein n=1 Tax=Camellia lanceoleosa TaxID=1840588 RepID=A0ACC0IPI9_9ERIC|nr:hypothetical protein LOK49_LG02G03174 [Camellia lanceoleosa]